MYDIENACVYIYICIIDIMHAYICVYIYIYIYVYICTYIYIFLQLSNFSLGGYLWMRSKPPRALLEAQLRRREAAMLEEACGSLRAAGATGAA